MGPINAAKPPDEGSSSAHYGLVMCARLRQGGGVTTELRSWTLDDAERLHEALRDSSGMFQQFGTLDTSSVEACAELIRTRLSLADPGGRDFAISIDGRAVGNIGVRHIEQQHNTAWVFYWLADEARGQGLAVRALATATQWAFAQDVFRVELGHRVNNTASCRVAIRAGFVVEGLERQKLRYGSERFDVETHARLAVDPTPPIELLPIAADLG
jgi:RimJ/RimL family protein N-acetyltransferase